MDPKLNMTYQSYLLRLWRVRDQDPWRATLKDVATGEEHHFPDLESLFGYLAQTGPHTGQTDSDLDDN